jgi:hypothetical protein
MGAHRRAVKACRRLTVNSPLSPFPYRADARKQIFRDCLLSVKQAKTGRLKLALWQYVPGTCRVANALTGK